MYFRKEKELLELQLENLNAEFQVRNRTCKDLAAQLKVVILFFKLLRFYYCIQL